ncbi:hypothetical protein F5Y17DRAFT_377756 [Xylariaceae sp. FL0594]|nr:hypothetical protein F5Y17DRAFT_377756 [Xylariaceae sp. FL0594]
MIMSLSSTTLLLYALAAILLSPVVVVVVLSQPHYILNPTLCYAPLLVAFTLYMIEDCSRWHTETILPWWTEARGSNMPRERPSLGSSQTLVYAHLPVLNAASGRLNYPSPPPTPILSPSPRAREFPLSPRVQDALLTRFMWSPSPSCASNFSSRLSDISLSSSIPESLPSSWGTLTRAWFPEFSTRDTDPVSWK